MAEEKKELINEIVPRDDGSLEAHGLRFIKDFITEEEEKQLIKSIDESKWSTTLNRRTQQYGYEYNYSSTKSRPLKTRIIPEIIQKIVLAKMRTSVKPRAGKWGDDEPNQCIINEYLPGQGIAPHTDHTKFFGDTICSLSLLSGCTMKFTLGKETRSVYLPPRSLVILEDDVRWKWKHEIERHRTDNVNGTIISRSRRVSITFRQYMTT